ncbi:conserved hypothetical protein [Erythrobacter sp. EC-HK427]|nr:conserved hypothetical protein [Erythrobacter sp. EC-HK427]
MRERELRMRILAIGLVAWGLGACASPDHQVAEARDPLTAPAGQNETLGEEIARQAGDGCLGAGNAGSRRPECRALREAIAPPEAPVPIPPPPPLPTQPDRDD